MARQPAVPVGADAWPTFDEAVAEEARQRLLQLQDDRRLAQRRRGVPAPSPAAKHQRLDPQFMEKKSEMNYYTTDKPMYFKELFKDLPFENMQSWLLQMRYKVKMDSILTRPDKDYLLEMNARAMSKARDPSAVQHTRRCGPSDSSRT